MIGLTQTWEDRKSATSASNEPYQQRAVLVRFCCDEWDEADRLQCITYKCLRGHFDEANSKLMKLTPERTLPGCSTASTCTPSR